MTSGWPDPSDEHYMRRCLQLARLGEGSVSPNPMVGAVLVCRDRIIGEGFHRAYGEAHAEVNCIASVPEEDRKLIPSSTMFVSLEPCAHFGKTPPCADLLVRHRVSRVVVGCRDPFDEVNGKGIGKLEAAGIPVTTGVLEAECRHLNRRFFTYHQRKRPWILLKWAQTADHFMAGVTGAGRLLISSPVTNRLVHQWRSRESAILVGSKTALQDDPALTNRLWSGLNPTRVLIDRRSAVPAGHQILDGSVPTIVYTNRRSEDRGRTRYQLIDPASSLLDFVLHDLYHRKLLSVMVEGGPSLLGHFIEAGLWDEARIITNTSLYIGQGLRAPVLLNAQRSANEGFPLTETGVPVMTGANDIVQTFIPRP